MYLFSTKLKRMATVAKPVESKQEGKRGAEDACGGEVESTTNVASSQGGEPLALVDAVSRAAEEGSETRGATAHHKAGKRHIRSHRGGKIEADQPISVY